MSKNKKIKKKIPRNGSALAASSRKGGPMKHRLEPKKGAKNKIQEILCDQEEDIEKYLEDLDDDCDI